MADRYAWDLDTPHPNVEIDALRVATKQALADLQVTAAGVDDTYWLADLLFRLLDTALADLAAAAEERGQCRDAIAALTARLDALQPPAPDLSTEVP